MTRWTILTGELPPHCGGVGDYTARLAAALAAAGDDVLVCVPGSPIAPAAIPRVELVLLPDRFGRRSRAVLDRIQQTRPARLIVQYVPNAFGLRGANLPICRWLRQRHDRGDSVALMFHEPYFYFGWHAPHRNALALVQRAMAALLLRAADEIYVATSAWNSYLAPFAPGSAPRPIASPIPSTIPAHADPAHRPWRSHFEAAGASRVVGHFGSYGPHIAPLLSGTLINLLESNHHIAALCMGRGSDEFTHDLYVRRPSLSGRVISTGHAPPADIAAAIATCDLMIQPYPDGVTTRRTTVMASLVNARPVLTTNGALTEALWHSTRAVALETVDAVALAERAAALLQNQVGLADLAARGEAAYRAHFALDHTIARLRRAREDAAA